MSDLIGQRGESIFYVLITRYYSRARPIFRPQFLGDKWPNIDFIVELEESTSGIKPFFFVQVKSTSSGYTKQDKRLKVSIKIRQLLALASYPVPTYIVGIDEQREVGFILSANGEWSKGIRSIPTNFPINEQNQDLLWQEVWNFWSKVGHVYLTSYFRDPKWSKTP